MARIFRYLDTVGDGSGEKLATGDYSVTPQEFKIAPEPGEIFSIGTMIISLCDDLIHAGSYGSMAKGPLDNGIRILLKRGTKVALDITENFPIKVVADWARLAFNAELKVWGSGQNNQFLIVRWTYERDGSPVTLSGDRNESLVLVLNDDFSHLTDHRFHIRGRTVT